MTIIGILLTTASAPLFAGDSPQLLSAMKHRLSYLGERQAVLSKNVANANTPKYKGKDLAPLDFNNLAKSQRGRVGMRATNKRHISRSSSRSGRFKTVENDAFETSPDGNNVTLDEEMIKVSENNMDYKETTGLYRKWSGLIRTAIRGSQ